jgi:hypothetical protein
MEFDTLFRRRPVASYSHTFWVDGTHGGALVCDAGHMAGVLPMQRPQAEAPMLQSNPESLKALGINS